MSKEKICKNCRYWLENSPYSRPARKMGKCEMTIQNGTSELKIKYPGIKP